MKKKILFKIYLILIAVISQKLLAQTFPVSSKVKIYQKFCDDWMSDIEVIDSKSGKIKTITTSKFYVDIKDGKIVRGDYCSQFGPLEFIVKQEFDSFGRQVEKLRFDSLNNFLNGNYFQYDSRGFLKKSRSFIKYDIDWGNKKKLVNSETIQMFYCDDLGCVYLINTLDIDDKVIRKKEFSYNDKNEIISASVFRKVKNTIRTKVKMNYLFKESQSFRFTLTQLENGYKITKYWRFHEDPLSSFQSEGEDFSDTFGSSQLDGDEISDSLFKMELLFKEIIVDTISNQVIVLCFDSDKKTLFKWIVDSLGREIETENNLNEDNYSHFSTVYNERNEEIKVTNLDKVGNFLKNGNKSFQYEYDPNGNWITKIESIDNVPTYIYHREIEYVQ
jgi:hypothetical protein